MLEVEVKYAVESPTSLREILIERFRAVFRVVRETDVYYNAPDRDFAHTDEALRIRRRVSRRGPEAVGEIFLTYKGPKLDTTTKTRREVELSLGKINCLDKTDKISESKEIEERGLQLALLLESLGYRAVGEVRKIREKTNCRWRNTSVEVSLDTLPQLQQRGDSGIFCELEILVPEEVSPNAVGGHLSSEDGGILRSVDRDISKSVPSETPRGVGEAGVAEAGVGEADAAEASVDAKFIAARAELFAFAAEIGLPLPQYQCRHSYLELVLADRSEGKCTPST